MSEPVFGYCDDTEQQKLNLEINRCFGDMIGADGQKTSAAKVAGSNDWLPSSQSWHNFFLKLKGVHSRLNPDDPLVKNWWGNILRREMENLRLVIDGGVEFSSAVDKAQHQDSCPEEVETGLNPWFAIDSGIEARLEYVVAECGGEEGLQEQADLVALIQEHLLLPFHQARGETPLIIL